MSKKSTKVLSGALATSLALGAMPVFADTSVDYDALYAVANEAALKAQKEGTQEAITAARTAIKPLLDAYNAGEEWLAAMVGTLSSMVDEVQQKLFNDFYAMIYDVVDGKPVLKETLTQAEIDEARDYVLGFKTYEGNAEYINTWSAAVDAFQQKKYDAAYAAVEKAEKSQLQEDIDAAQKLMDELATSKNAEVAKWVTDVQAKLDAVVVKLIVESVSAINTPEGDKLEVVLSDVPEEKPTAKSVTVTRTINGEEDASFVWDGGVSSWNEETKTLTISEITPVEATEEVQEVVYSVAYGDTDAVAANALTVEAVEKGLAVESVSAITKTGVTVAFKEAPEKDLEGVTVKVVNNEGKEVEIVALDILKGEKEVTFKFAKSLTEDPKGVWTVDGVAHDIDTLKLIEKVGELAEESTLKELDFYDALAKLGIKNVDATKLQAYANEIKLAKPTTVEAIQKAVDKGNEGSVAADEKKDIAVAVYEAKDNAVTLRAALLDNEFKYVNTELIADYQTKLKTSAFTGIASKDAVTAAEYDKIQADINTVNNTAITTAKSAIVDVKTANEYKALVFDYMVDDAAGVDTKAKALEEADKFIALMELKASDSSVETYRLLAQLLGDDAKLLNDNNKKEYYDAKVAYKTGDPAVSSITTVTTASDLVTNVVDKGDKAALDNALAAIAGMTANTAPAGQADNGTKVEIVKANLQKLADVTNHKKDDAKFDMAIVKDAKLADYRDALLADGVPATLTTAKAVTDVIEGINADVDEDARVKAVNEASTAAEMKVALTDIALEEANTAYINLSSEAKLEVAEMVLEARPSKGFEATTGESAKTASEVISVEITTQLGARKALIDNVNKIDVVGDTAAFDFDAVDTVLTALEYDAYNDLEGLARVNAAQAFYDNIPTVEKKDGTLEQVEYKTLAEIKVAIDAAIK